MAFEKKTWKDRITEYPTRRSLKRSDGSTELVTVTRAEGDVSQEGDAFSAANMNNLEDRIADNFGNCSFSVQPDGAYVTYIPEGGADAVTKKLGSISNADLRTKQYSGTVRAYGNNISIDISNMGLEVFAGLTFFSADINVGGDGRGITLIPVAVSTSTVTLQCVRINGGQDLSVGISLSYYMTVIGY